MLLQHRQQYHGACTGTVWAQCNGCAPIFGTCEVVAMRSKAVNDCIKQCCIVQVCMWSVIIVDHDVCGGEGDHVVASSPPNASRNMLVRLQYGSSNFGTTRQMRTSPIQTIAL
jgi:hypothetical protein